MLGLRRRKANRRLPPPGARPGRRRAVAWGVAALALAGGFWAGVPRLVHQDWLPVRKVQVHGESQHLGQPRLRKLVMAYTAGGMLATDVTALRAALAREPWLRTVTVRRLWPDTMHIVLEEQVAVARWGEVALVNRQGELFSPPQGSFPAGLPRWDGPAGMQGLLGQRYRELSRMVAVLGLGIARLSLDERRAWHLQLTNGIAVELGRKGETERLASFVRVYPKVLAGQAPRIAVVDLRYKNGFTVRWRPASQVPAGDNVKKA